LGFPEWSNRREEKKIKKQYEYRENPAGYVLFKNEKELCRFLKANFLRDYIEQFKMDDGCIVDFCNLDSHSYKKFIEVKNWFVTIKDMEQFLKYFIHASEIYGENNFRLMVVAGGIEPLRKAILEKIGIQVVLTKDLVYTYEQRI